MNTVQVTRAKWGGVRKNWIVRDHLDKKEYVFSSWHTAVREAHRLARTGFISPFSLVGVNRCCSFGS